jgi:hypothetical protein
VELGQKVQKPLAIFQEDILHSPRFLGVRNKNLEDVERLVLDVLALISEQVHRQLEVFRGVNICQHDIVICAVEQNFAEELDGLSLGNVVGGDKERVVSRKKLRCVKM